MVEPVIENLRALGEEIATDLGERFGSEHLALAMDRILPGPCYVESTPDHPTLPDPVTGVVPEDDDLDTMLAKLEQRMGVYVKYDEYMAENGYVGNREVDAAIQRLETLKEHIAKTAVSLDEPQFCGLTPEQFLLSPIVLRESRCRKISLMSKINLMFLAREVLNRDFTFYTHGPVFDFFVQKNPFKTIPQQDKIKKRLLLMPRGAFKSVADGIDTVQWIILNPDVRIVFLTATLLLAKEFVREVRGYFEIDGDLPDALEKPLEYAQWLEGLSPFKYIFARDARLERPKKKNAQGQLEYQRLCFLLERGEGKETELNCPARSKGSYKKKEVTLWANSVKQAGAGQHSNIVKADDAVNKRNSENPKLIRKTINDIGMVLKILDPGGYNDNIGTPYAPNDWYSHVETNFRNVLILKRPADREHAGAPAKWPKRDINGATAFQRGVSALGHPIHEEKDLADTDWTLLFPFDKYGVDKLTHDQLRMNQAEDAEGFPSQYMLDRSGYRKVSFPNHLIEQQTIMPDAMPAQMEKFVCYILWDLADTQTNTADYSVGVVLMVDREGRGYVVEVFRDRWTYHEICQIIAKTNHEYKPASIIIEDARGASKLKGQMEQASKDLGDKMIPLNFVPVKNYKASKSIRIGKLEPRMRNRTLWFLSTISCYADLVREFADFGSDPHDDIPDAIALCEHVLLDVRPQPSDPGAAALAQRIIEEKQFFEMIHMSPEPEIVDVTVEPLENTEGRDEPDDLWDPFGAVQFKK